MKEPIAAWGTRPSPLTWRSGEHPLRRLRSLRLPLRHLGRRGAGGDADERSERAAAGPLGAPRLVQRPRLPGARRTRVRRSAVERQKPPLQTHTHTRRFAHRHGVEDCRRRPRICPGGAFPGRWPRLWSSLRNSLRPVGCGGQRVALSGVPVRVPEKAPQLRGPPVIRRGGGRRQLGA